MNDLTRFSDLMRLPNSRNLRFVKQVHNMLDNMSNMFDQQFGSMGLSPVDGLYEGFLPAANVSIKDNKKNISLEIPGLTKDDISINIDGSVLTIAGKKEKCEKQEDEHVVSCEIVTGNFERQFQLTEYEADHADNISALFKNGILTISIPTSESKREVKKIDITQED
ncbi:MAG: Hsp20/alpha crystallin family protein [Elusimicrobiota bacterium]